MNEIETFYGLLEGTADALRVFALCREGRLGRLRRRLHEKERKSIRSGSVFVFDEQESGIRRWTDGRLWSPSRIMGNFLVYRELERRPSPEQEAEQLAKDPMAEFFETALLEENEGDKRSRRQSTGSSSSATAAASLLGPNAERLLHSKKLQSSAQPTSSAFSPSTTLARPRYRFRPNGLLKKTISAKVDGRIQHLVCYFSEADFLRVHTSHHDDEHTQQHQQQDGERMELLKGLLDELRKTQVPVDLLMQQTFRKPTDLGLPALSTIAKRPHSSPIQGRSSTTGASERRPRLMSAPPDLPLDLSSSAIASIFLFDEQEPSYENCYPTDLCLQDLLPKQMFPPAADREEGDENGNAALNRMISQEFSSIPEEAALSAALLLNSEDSYVQVPHHPHPHLHSHLHHQHHMKGGDPLLPSIDRPDSLPPFNINASDC